MEASSSTFRLRCADGRQLALWVNERGELTFAITYESFPGAGEGVLHQGYAEAGETPLQVRQLGQWAAHVTRETGGA